MHWLFIFLIIIGVLAFWELRISEGAHLGRGFVVLLYDLAAKRYDGIKQFDFDWEHRILGEPISDILLGLEDARILDVGCGSGYHCWRMLGAKFSWIFLSGTSL